MRNPYVIGPSVKLPTDFFGRARQTRQFFETLAGAQIQCVSVLGLRRAGKTSFMQYVAHPEVMAAHLPDPERYLMLYVDLSTCKTAAEFYTRVYRRLLEALPRAARAERSVTTADVYAVESLLYEFSGRRVVLLMDEFDQLRTADFSGDFMTELRALAGVWDYELAYVTASYWDLYRLGNFVGLPPTSPFYNIFFPTPIYLSGLSAVELDDLVRVPARRVGIIADDEDVAYVRHNAGSLPFFVQAMAAVWLEHKTQARRPDTRDLTQRLVSEMWPYYEQWWRNFSDVERDVLAAVVGEKPVERLPYDEPEVDHAVQRLTNYGVIIATGSHLWPDSRMFSHWLGEYAGRNKRNTPASTVAALSNKGMSGEKPVFGADESRAARLLRTIHSAGEQFERRPTTHDRTHEEALRDHVLSALKTAAADSPIGETLAAMDRTGILVRVDGMNVFVVECGFWKGQKDLLRTVAKLLNGLIGRDAGAAVVVFARDGELPFVAQAIAQAMPRHPGYLGFDGRPDPSRLDYRFHLNGDPQHEVRLSVLLFRLPD